MKSLAESYRRFFTRISRHVHLDDPETWTARLAKAGFTVERHWHYFPPSALAALEWGHYFGLPSLITRKLFRQVDSRQSPVESCFDYEADPSILRHTTLRGRRLHLLHRAPFRINGWLWIRDPALLSKRDLTSPGGCSPPCCLRFWHNWILEKPPLNPVRYPWLGFSIYLVVILLTFWAWLKGELTLAPLPETIFRIDEMKARWGLASIALVVLLLAFLLFRDNTFTLLNLTLWLLGLGLTCAGFLGSGSG